MVIDIALKIVEQTTKLAELGEGRREDFFNRHIESIYSELEEINKDYKIIFQEIIQSLDDINTDVDELAVSVKKARINNEARREKLKALTNAIGFSNYAEVSLGDKLIPKSVKIKNLTHDFALAILKYFNVIIVGEDIGSTSFHNLITVLNNYSYSKRPDWTPSRRDYHYLKAKREARNLAYNLDMNFIKASACYA